MVFINNTCCSKYEITHMDIVLPFGVFLGNLHWYLKTAIEFALQAWRASEGISLVVENEDWNADTLPGCIFLLAAASRKFATFFTRACSYVSVMITLKFVSIRQNTTIMLYHVIYFLFLLKSRLKGPLQTRKLKYKFFAAKCNMPRSFCMLLFIWSTFNRHICINIGIMRRYTCFSVLNVPKRA